MGILNRKIFNKVGWVDARNGWRWVKRSATQITIIVFMGGNYPPYKSINLHHAFGKFPQVAHIDVVMLSLKLHQLLLD